MLVELRIVVSKAALLYMQASLALEEDICEKMYMEKIIWIVNLTDTNDDTSDQESGEKASAFSRLQVQQKNLLKSAPIPMKMKMHVSVLSRSKLMLKKKVMQKCKSSLLVLSHYKDRIILNSEKALLLIYT
ncbi:uncharacterized protein BT62DRAFT_922935 [Guyanagaster necrorhizus]|uniref:Uncharacterized protein n=1 Tax=Guyanagaster necrorhizus TaxID=856835 RepID=A0A9P7VKC5_9AGAR|nr:uncharacterized protein BT62DRAFT_922935 [Guyanagaster necrorhizus MCA 3950]KAG7442135.1 hypothetical protein BT62DRAFT_922935 [Guyanagaster necrorhizus MCA 3950]